MLLLFLTSFEVANHSWPHHLKWPFKMHDLICICTWYYYLCKYLPNRGSWKIYNQIYILKWVFSDQVFKTSMCIHLYLFSMHALTLKLTNVCRKQTWKVCGQSQADSLFKMLMNIDFSWIPIPVWYQPSSHKPEQLAECPRSHPRKKCKKD